MQLVIEANFTTNHLFMKRKPDVNVDDSVKEVDSDSSEREHKSLGENIGGSIKTDTFTDSSVSIPIVIPPPGNFSLDLHDLKRS